VKQMPKPLNFWTTYITIVTYRTLYTHQPTYLVNLLHLLDISRTLRSSISKQLLFLKLSSILANVLSL